MCSMFVMKYIPSFIFAVFSFVSSFAVEIDENGYILYCPCMGRFGNQADHFLGALGFAKGLNRTLTLPPWVEYRYGAPRSIQVPFDTYFEVEPLRKYHRVITMEEFMEKLAPKIWPPEKRTVFCYSQRGNNVGCNAKEGNPFGPFWDTFGVDFVASQFYGPLHFDVYHHDMANSWNIKFPPKKWPVMAFMGAPASFPIQKENRELHQYLFWNERVLNKAKRFIKNILPKGGFVGIHLRNGVDWGNACSHIKHSPKLFAAPQCLGYNNERGVATNEMCMPSTETVIRQLKRVIRGMKDVASVFVASDSNHMLPELRTALKRMEIEVHKLEPPNPHVELAILGLSNHFIANCISSFSSFAKRERDARGYPSSFWAFPPERSRNGSKGHDEL